MLSESTKKRIKDRKTLKHSNPSQFLKRVKNECNQDIKDLTFMAKYSEEKDLEEIFTAEKLDPLIRALLNPKNKRAIDITEMLANCVFQKLVITLPNDMVNDLGGDIGKTWTFAKVAKDFWNKPLVEEK